MSSGPVPLHLLPDSATVDGGDLAIGGCKVVDLVTEFGSPLFIYDEQQLIDRCDEAVAAFGEGVAYASKAFLCRAMAKIASRAGMAIDVATGGELHIVMSAGVAPSSIVFHGNNKSPAELRAALTAGVGRVVIDSFDEMDRIETLVSEGLPSPTVLVRINPGIEAHTHEYLQTGITDSKFGFPLAEGIARRAIDRAIESDAMEFVGIHAHIGSQVFDVASYARAITEIAPFLADSDATEFSLGGGLGVAYVEGEDESSITQWAEIITEAADAAGISATITAEPGRAIVARAAVTAYTIGTVKDIPGVRRYLAVDGGMSDNPRPLLYGSGYETFLARAVTEPRPRSVRVVGKHCESGDVIVRDAKVPSDAMVGDILCTPVTGAYGQSMGSNYNKVLRPAVVFAKDGDARLVVRRETFDDLLATDVG